MEKKAEIDLLNSGQSFKADVFKLNHHGSSSSNRKNFLMAVNPKYVVASVGKDNPHRHPHGKVLNLLRKLNIKNIYRTDFNGNIIFTTDGNNIDVKTSKKGEI